MAAAPSFPTEAAIALLRAAFKTRLEELQKENQQCRRELAAGPQRMENSLKMDQLHLYLNQVNRLRSSSDHIPCFNWLKLQAELILPLL